MKASAELYETESEALLRSRNIAALGQVLVPLCHHVGVSCFGWFWELNALPVLWWGGYRQFHVEALSLHKIPNWWKHVKSMHFRSAGKNSFSESEPSAPTKGNKFIACAWIVQWWPRAKQLWLTNSRLQPMRPGSVSSLAWKIIHGRVLQISEVH